MNPIQTLLDALKANHERHVDNSDEGCDYSPDLWAMNEAAIATATALVTGSVAVPKDLLNEAVNALGAATFAALPAPTMRRIEAAHEALRETLK